MTNEYFSCAEVAQIAGVKTRTVWNWVNSGKLRASRPGGRNYLIKKTDLEAFLDKDNRKNKET